MSEQIKQDGSGAESEATREIEIGKVYRLAKNAPTGALKYDVLYGEGKYIKCRVLSGPDENGVYTVETMRNGEPIGDRGWPQEEYFFARNLEDIDEG